MNGYVKNMTYLWAHTMKRSVGPGAKIPLDDLYEQYGKRHNLKKGKEFTQWLTEVKLRDKNKWQIFTDNDTPHGETTPDKELKAKADIAGKTNKSRGENVAPPVATNMEIEDVVELSVRKAREVIPTIRDMQLLKYAENIARQRTGKDSLRVLLLKRIQELSVSNRR